MPGLDQTQLVDLLATTQARYKKVAIQTQRDTDYPGARILFNQPKEDLPGGSAFEVSVRVRDKGTARLINAYDQTPVTQREIMRRLRVTWVAPFEHMLFDILEDNLNQGGAERIVNLYEQRRGASKESWNNLLETMIWSPGPSSTADKLFTGMPYWFPSLAIGASDPVGGFNGTTVIFEDGSTSSTIANQDRTNINHERLRSFVGTYTAGAVDTLIRLTRRALKRTGFRMIPGLPGQNPSPNQMGYIFTSENLHDELEDRVNKGPDDLQGDEARFTEPKIRRVPVVPTPRLNGVAHGSVFGARPPTVRGWCVRGMWEQETKPKPVDANFTSVAIGWLGQGNLIAEDVRSGGFHLHTVRAA
jgi:hypothetical protein